MRTTLEFRSPELSDAIRDDGTPYGETVASLLRDELSEHGFSVTDVFAEDWGWHVAVANAAFRLWIGCGHYEEWHDGLLCFIKPSRPYVLRWFRRVPTSDTVERLATAVESVIRDSGKAYDLRWWTTEENARG